MSTENSNTPEFEVKIEELKKQIKKALATLKETNGVKLEEDLAFIAPKYTRRDTSEGLISWSEAIYGTHIVLEHVVATGIYRMGLVSFCVEDEPAQRLVIQGNKISYSEGYYNWEGRFRWKGKSIREVPKNIVSQFCLLLKPF
jgi:hypothetical protein